MADEKKPEEKPINSSWFSHPDPFVEVVWGILTIFVLLYILNGLIGLINSGKLPILGYGQQNSIPLSRTPSLIGDDVETSRQTSVFSRPGFNLITTKPTGSKATILEGPLIHDGEKYWHVRFTDGTEGWVKEDDLGYLTTEKKPLSQVKDRDGTRISVSKQSSPYFLEPGSGQLGIKNINSEGDIIDGPVTEDGVRYWKVQFDDGSIGWVDENDLDYISKKTVPLSSMPSVIGGEVRPNKSEIELLDSPGGVLLGTVDRSVSGKIIEGPIIKDGVRYWHVKFENGQEGWVAERDLEYLGSSRFGWFSKTISYFKKVFLIFKYIAVFFSLVLILWIIYLYKKLAEARREEAKQYYVEPININEINKLRNPQWDKVMTHIESPNESDWRLAILEADIMLDTLLDNLSLPGDTMGEKLKAVERSDFTTIDNAWDAHKVRNQIAHEGSTFVLSQHEAKRVIDLYKTVFEEFKII